jgi:hypothetical protein
LICAHLLCVIFLGLKNFSLRLIHLIIPLYLKLRRTNRQKNQIFLSGIRHALGRTGGDALQVTRVHRANDFTVDFYFALAGEDVVNFIRAADKVQYRGDVWLNTRSGDGHTRTISGIEQFCDVAALLKVVFRCLIRNDYGRHGTGSDKFTCIIRKGTHYPKKKPR